jgi:hypothetical protein
MLEEARTMINGVSMFFVHIPATGFSNGLAPAVVEHLNA